FWVQGKRYAAGIAVLSVIAAATLIEIVRLLVPRHRPQDAVLWLGQDGKYGSYPSAGVLLFMLVMILLARAAWPFLRRPWLGGVFVGVAALLVGWICIGQFFLSIHFVTDVIGGLAGAAVIGWIATKLMAGPASRAL